MMRKKAIIAFLIIGVFLFGCQYNKISDGKGIKLSDSTNQKANNAEIDEALEKELEDNLGRALEELGEIEKI